MKDGTASTRNFAHGEFDCTRFVKRQFRHPPVTESHCLNEHMKADERKPKNEAIQHAGKMMHNGGDVDD